MHSARVRRFPAAGGDIIQRPGLDADGTAAMLRERLFQAADGAYMGIGTRDDAVECAESGGDLIARSVQENLLRARSVEVEKGGGQNEIFFSNRRLWPPKTRLFAGQLELGALSANTGTASEHLTLWQRVPRAEVKCSGNQKQQEAPTPRKPPRTRAGPAMRGGGARRRAVD
ncbi:hypothetical protein MRX96_042943 [Rhipicephalus microplus]